MTSRGGRLSADIQAVVAADYIRNLREEVKKGQRGRLKQGLYPWAAPCGYLDTGKGGQEKGIDPVAGPLVQRAFETYATGDETLRSLVERARAWGLRSRSGRPVSLSRLNKILRRRFYIGIVDVAGTSYMGKHEPLVSKELFDKVQEILDGRSRERVNGERTYPLKRLLRCGSCGGYLYAETQKGRAYYRCHRKSCRGTCVSEEAVLAVVVSDVSRMALTDEFVDACADLIEQLRGEAAMQVDAGRNVLRLRSEQIAARHARLVDAYLERALDRQDYETRRSELMEEQARLREQEAGGLDLAAEIQQVAQRFFELAKGLSSLPEVANRSELAALFRSSISNISVVRKNLVISWVPALRVLLGATDVLGSAHSQDGHRTPETDQARAKLLVEQLVAEAHKRANGSSSCSENVHKSAGPF
jgi:site-specific DNA recombinase